MAVGAIFQVHPVFSDISGTLFTVYVTFILNLVECVSIAKLVVVTMLYATTVCNVSNECVLLHSNASNKFGSHFVDKVQAIPKLKMVADAIR